MKTFAEILEENARFREALTNVHRVVYTSKGYPNEQSKAVEAFCLEALNPRRTFKLVILESPYRGNRLKHEAYGRKALRDSLLRGEAPLASHLLYTQDKVLVDLDPEERNIGIEAGLAWGKHAAATVVYSDMGISAGMQRGIARAKEEGRLVEYRYISMD